MGEFGQRIREPAGPDVVDREHRARRPERRAGVDDLLRPALDLGVAALDRIEVEVGDVRSRLERGRGAAAHADQHPGAAELHERSTRGNRALEGERRADVADPAGDHDRLVVAPDDAARRNLERAEVAGEVRTPELVVERGGADRSLEHDLERRGDPVGLARVVLPGLDEPRDAQVRHAEPAQAGLRLRAAPGGAFVAELAPGSGCRARERRDRRRVVVRLDLRQVVGQLFVRAVPAVGVGEEAAREAPLEHRRVVGVGEDRALRIGRVRRADHPEQRVLARNAVDDPRRVEDLVPAVLRVRLREHRQLDVGRVAPEPSKDVDEIVDLVVGEREPQRGVRALDRAAPACEHRHPLERARRRMAEQRVGGLDPLEHRLGHPVVQERRDPVAAGAAARHVMRNAALHSAHEAEPAVASDVGGLRGPGRDRPEARRYEVERGIAGRLGGGGAIAEEPVEERALGRVRGALDLDEVPELARRDGETRIEGVEGGIELRPAERGERRAPAQTENRHQDAAVSADYTGARRVRLWAGDVRACAPAPRRPVSA